MDMGKAHVLTASYNGAVIWNSIERSQRTMVAEPIRIGTMPSPDGSLKGGQAMRIYDIEGKAVTLKGQGGGSGAKTGLYAEPICVAQRGRYDEEGDIYQHLEPNENGKTNALTTVSKDNLIAEPINTFNDEGEKARTLMAGCYKYGMATMITNEGFKGGTTGVAEPLRIREATKQGYAEISEGGCVDMSMPNSKTRRGRNMEDKSNCLQTSNEFYQYMGTINAPVYEVKDGMITVKDKQYPIKLVDGYYIIRKLTVKECMRLQTVPEWYDFSCVSNSQAYKMLGNGWTVEVIAHLINSVLKDA